MLSVSTALARLQDGLGESFPDSPGTRIIDVAFPLNDAFDPLAMVRPAGAMAAVLLAAAQWR